MKDDMLSVNNLVNAYSNGYFPMADENGKISWYCPDIRAIFPFYNLRYLIVAKIPFFNIIILSLLCKKTNRKICLFIC